jgi:MSHA pilin protein MshD
MRDPPGEDRRLIPGFDVREPLKRRVRHLISSSAQQGFTLLEVLIASVILSLAVAALSQAIVSGQSHAYDSLHRMRAMALAQSLMEEIIALPYRDPQGTTAAGPDAGENRRDRFDNMDDFHGYTETAGTLADYEGELYDQPYQMFARQVTATYKTTTLDGHGAVKGLEIRVVVSDARDREWELVRFVPEPVEQEPAH